MIKFVGLVLLSALLAVGGDRVSINNLLDGFIERLNNQQRRAGTTSAPFPEIPLVSGVKYPDAVFLGADSLHRTSDCWLEADGSDVSLDINYGFQLLVIMLPHLEINGKNMSAFVTVGKNSAHLAFTVHGGDNHCYVKLNKLRVEKMENVEFRASRPEYSSNLDDYFASVIVPTLNGIVESSFDKIEQSLQAICRSNDFHNEFILRKSNAH